MTSVTDPAGGATTFVYDAQGNLTKTTDAGGVVSNMTYDTLGRKLEMQKYETANPSDGVWTYAYNGFGDLVRQTDARSQVQVMAYDGLGRMICRRDESSGGTPSCSTPDTSSFEGAATWTYDIGANALGQVTSVNDAVSNFQKSYTYDEKGRVSVVSTTIDGTAYFEKTTYDDVGRVYQIFDAAGDGSFSDYGVAHDYNDYGYLELVGDAREVDGQPRTVYRQVTSMNARGQVEFESLGDGVVTTDYSYFATTGRMNSILSVDADTGVKVQDLAYTWDGFGNLRTRTEKSGSKNLSESFDYDNLNRLIQQAVSGSAAVTVQYTANGNIRNKSDVGSADYTYSSVHPHAVETAGGNTYAYDANGNNTGGDGRTISYTVFDKPDSIIRGSDSITFEYGPNRARYKRVDAETGNNPRTTLYIGSVEIITRPDGKEERKRYIAGIAIETSEYESNGTRNSRVMEYLFKDHLGSLDVITDDEGVVDQELSFDAWGQRRNATNWNTLTGSALTDFDTSRTTRGFTGHEMLDKVGIVHMNGRIYDAKIGRFLQADPFVQEPDNTQNFNRYSYVLNNPLNATDPSGFFFVELLVAALKGSLVGWVGKELDIPLLSTIGNAWACGLSGGAICAAGFSFGATVGSGGSIRDAFRAGAFAGVSAATFGEIGKSFRAAGKSGSLRHIFAHAFVGGILEVTKGGKFGHGFLSAGLTKGVMSRAGFDYEDRRLESIVARTTVAAMVGGTSAAISGGKFANGASTAAMAHLFNQEGIDKAFRKNVVAADNRPRHPMRSAVRADIKLGAGPRLGPLSLEGSTNFEDAEGGASLSVPIHRAVNAFFAAGYSDDGVYSAALGIEKEIGPGAYSLAATASSDGWYGVEPALSVGGSSLATPVEVNPSVVPHNADVALQNSTFATYVIALHRTFVQWRDSKLESMF